MTDPDPDETSGVVDPDTGPAKHGEKPRTDPTDKPGTEAESADGETRKHGEPTDDAEGTPPAW